MNEYTIKDFEISATTSVKAQGVAEAMFEYLSWPTLDLSITFRESEGWIVTDNKTDFLYEVASINMTAS